MSAAALAAEMFAGHEPPFRLPFSGGDHLGVYQLGGHFRSEAGQIPVRKGVIFGLSRWIS
jgi:hypothetical protein